ncbi:probable G-protein coupled receptor 101 [Hypanus sabinus]|uniref:probable G-protein coupled receptor 101 n=1 Tax=Hypanus sabinus TaxID=79690 RepID=UPI0028C3F489|nr:probable G-protein coupled receptor 101 [Hypanus sabinus]
MSTLTLHSNTTDSTAESGLQVLPAHTLLRVTLLSAILGTSLLGNGLVLSVFQSKPQLLHVANRFVFNLLLADLLQTVVVMPLVIAGSVPGMQPLNRGLCMALVVLAHLFAFAGVHTIVVVSIDRYLAIIHPLSYPSRMTTRRGSHLIALTWLLGMVQSTPPLYGWGQVTFDGHAFCSLAWSSSPSYSLMTTLLGFWLPALIMLGCYWMVFRAARRQNALVHPAHSNGPPRGWSCTNTSAHSSGVRIRTRRSLCHCKAARVVCVIMSSFLLSMGPYSILGTMSISRAPSPPSWLSTVALVLFYSQCSVHPYIYGYLHRSIRREFLRLLTSSCSGLLQPRALPLHGHLTTMARKVLRPHCTSGASRACALRCWAEEPATALTPMDLSGAQSPQGCRRETVSTSCSSQNELPLLPSQASGKGRDWTEAERYS